MIPMPTEVAKRVSVFAKNQPGNIVFADRSGNNTIEDLSTEEEGDANDDGHDGYSSGEDSSGTEGDESLVFDVDVSEGDREVTDAVENILPELPGTMGLSERELGRIQGVGIDSDGGEEHGDEILESESGSENGSNDDVTENNRVTEDVLDLAKNSNEGFIEEVDQSIVDLANAFEARLDDPGLDTPPVSPSADDKDTSPQDLPPNYVNRFGREIRPRRFLMHESFEALVMGEGDPELWRPSAQTSYGMFQKQVKDKCFSIQRQFTIV